MNRYNAAPTRVFKRYDGKQVFNTTRYPKIPVSIDDVYVFANDSDYLDTMAQKFYKDSTLWWIIAQANGIKNTLKAPTGKQLRIPQNTGRIISEYNQANRR